MILAAPEPHLLDFDWRFTDRTVETLVTALRGKGMVLTVGTPSVALKLERRGTDTLLIDRQPLQAVNNHFTLDPGLDNPLDSLFDIAIVDSPWYPKVQRRWLAWTALHLRPGGKMLASMWQDQTRPDAAAERVQLLEWIKHWAHVEIQPAVLQYQTPLFEFEAARVSGALIPSQDWRQGDLLKILPFRRPTLPSVISGGEQWVRFIFDNYQLAVRMRSEKERTRLLPVSGAFGWTWPSVSRRIAGHGTIDLWSSRNEVARVEGSEELVSYLRAIAQLGRVALSEQPSSMNALAQWTLPPGPYWRTYEWTHRA